MTARPPTYLAADDQVRLLLGHNFDHLVGKQAAVTHPRNLAQQHLRWRKRRNIALVAAGAVLLLAAVAYLSFYVTREAQCPANLVRVSGKCKQCTRQDNCGALVCDTQSQKCVPCIHHAHCQLTHNDYTGAAPSALATASRCASSGRRGGSPACLWACQSNDDCSNVRQDGRDLSTCTGGVCRECGSASDCPVGPGALPASVICEASVFRCSECDAAAGRGCKDGYACRNGTCHAVCARAGETTPCPAGQRCLAKDGVCVVCDASTNDGCDGSSSRPFCRPDQNACVQCLKDSDCAGTTRCDGAYKCTSALPGARRVRLVAVKGFSNGDDGVLSGVPGKSMQVVKRKDLAASSDLRSTFVMARTWDVAHPDRITFLAPPPATSKSEATLNQNDDGDAWLSSCAIPLFCCGKDYSVSFPGCSQACATLDKVSFETIGTAESKEPNPTTPYPLLAWANKPIANDPVNAPPLERLPENGESIALGWETVRGRLFLGAVDEINSPAPARYITPENTDDLYGIKWHVEVVS